MSESVCGHPGEPIGLAIDQKATWMRLSALQTTAEADVCTVDVAKLMQEHRPWNGLPINTECTECQKVSLVAFALKMPLAKQVDMILPA
jgi:hypothetical protein